MSPKSRYEVVLERHTVVLQKISRVERELNMLRMLSSSCRAELESLKDVDKAQLDLLPLFP